MSSMPNKWHDATIVTPFNIEAYQGRTIRISQGRCRSDTYWPAIDIPFPQLIRNLSIGVVGERDGDSMVLGGTSNGNRHRSAMQNCSGLVVDCESEIASAELDGEIGKLGCLAVRFTSYSHSREKPRHRLVIPFSHEFYFIGETINRQQALQKWSDVGRALTNELGTGVWQASGDPARMFYLPRHAPLADWEISLFGGPLFDWRTLKLANNYPVWPTSAEAAE